MTQHFVTFPANFPDYLKRRILGEPKETTMHETPQDYPSHYGVDISRQRAAAEMGYQQQAMQSTAGMVGSVGGLGGGAVEAQDSALVEIGCRLSAITDQLANGNLAFSAQAGRVFGGDPVAAKGQTTTNGPAPATPRPAGAIDDLQSALDRLSGIVNDTCGYTHVFGRL